MAKFCGNCGYQAEDNDNVCGQCGTVFADAQTTFQAPVQDVAEATSVQTDFQQPNASPVKQLTPEQKAKIKKFGIIGGIAAAAIAVVAIVLVIVLNSTGYKGLINNVMDDLVQGKADAFVDNLSEVYDNLFDSLEAQSEEDSSYTMDADLFASQLELRYDQILDKLEDEVGNGCNYSYEIIETSELSERKVKNVVDELGEAADDVEISAVMDVEVELTATKGSEKESVKITFRLFKTDGWKMYSITDVDY